MMTPELQALTDQVTANTAIAASAVTLINGIAARIDAAKTDPAALTALADSLRSSDTDLAAAIEANTPATTPPVDVPTVDVTPVDEPPVGRHR